MEIGDILEVAGRSSNQGTPFSVDVEVLALSLDNHAIVINTLNGDNFEIDIKYGIFKTPNNKCFYSDNFTLFNKTQQERVF